MEDIRQTLLKIPSDHYFETTNSNDNNDEDKKNKKQHSFLELLQVVHSVAAATKETTTSTNGEHSHSFAFGTCPVASIVPSPPLSNSTRSNPTTKKEDAASMSFTQAMEHCSLASVMAKMAHQMEQHSQQFKEHAISSQEQEENNEIQPKTNKETPVTMVEESSSLVSSSIVLDPDNPNYDDTSYSFSQPTQSKQSQTSSSSLLLLLSKAFQVGTQDSHQAAENVHFVKNFIQGKIDRFLYVQLLQRLYPVYQTLEQQVLVSSSNDTPKDPILQSFASFHERLQRTDALAQDLEYWNGDGTTTTLSPATRDYVDRILEIAQSSDPWLLLSHSYTRYLGDLSGGKILGRVARKALFGNTRSNNNSTDRHNEGLAFYDFSQTIPSAKKFKDEYRNALDQLNVSEEQLQKLVAEANVAFVLNIRLFEELDVVANVPGASVRPLSEALAYATTASQNIQQKKNQAPISSHPHPTTPSSTTVNATPCPFIVQSSSLNPTTGTASNHNQHNNNAPCPFLVHSKDLNQTVEEPSNLNVSSKRCPWPFILLHDPRAALQDWQTWAVLGLILCFAWNRWMMMMEQSSVASTS
jgi:heme oxygenase